MIMSAIFIEMFFSICGACALVGTVNASVANPVERNLRANHMSSPQSKPSIDGRSEHPAVSCCLAGIQLVEQSTLKAKLSSKANSGPRIRFCPFPVAERRMTAAIEERDPTYPAKISVSDPELHFRFWHEPDHQRCPQFGR